MFITQKYFKNAIREIGQELGKKEVYFYDSIKKVLFSPGNDNFNNTSITRKELLEIRLVLQETRREFKMLLDYLNVEIQVPTKKIVKKVIK